MFKMSDRLELHPHVLQTSSYTKHVPKLFASKANIQVLVVFYNWCCTTSASLVLTHFFFNCPLAQTWSLAASYWTSNMFEKQLQGWQLWTSQMPTFIHFRLQTSKGMEVCNGIRLAKSHHFPSLSLLWKVKVWQQTTRYILEGVIAVLAAVYQQPNIHGGFVMSLEMMCLLNLVNNLCDRLENGLFGNWGALWMSPCPQNKKKKSV